MKGLSSGDWAAEPCVAGCSGNLKTGFNGIKGLARLVSNSGARWIGLCLTARVTKKSQRHRQESPAHLFKAGHVTDRPKDVASQHPPAVHAHHEQAHKCRQND